MTVYIIDNDSDCIDPLRQLFKNGGHTVINGSYDQIRQDSVRASDLVVLSGGIWYEDPSDHAAHYNNELDLIIDSPTPILGVCLGMLLIASKFGAELETKPRQLGAKLIKLTDKGRRIYGLEKFKAAENHTVSLIKTPQMFTTYARSKCCIEVISHCSKPIIGVQFHPELSDQSDTEVTQFWQTTIKNLSKYSL